MSPIVLSAASSVAVASARASSNFQRARVAAASSSKVTKKSLASSSSSSLAARAVVVVARGESSSRARRARGSPIVRAAAEDTEESTAAPATPPSAPKPASTKPGQGKPPIAPSYLALGDATASILIVLIARGAAGQDVLSPGTIIAIPPFVLGWVGAGFFAGDYDADSPNAALWGDVPRAMSTGALTWFRRVICHTGSHTAALAL